MPKHLHTYTVFNRINGSNASPAPAESQNSAETQTQSPEQMGNNMAERDSQRLVKANEALDNLVASISPTETSTPNQPEQQLVVEVQKEEEEAKSKMAQLYNKTSNALKGAWTKTGHSINSLRGEQKVNLEKTSQEDISEMFQELQKSGGGLAEIQRSGMPPSFTYKGRSVNLENNPHLKKYFESQVNEAIRKGETMAMTNRTAEQQAAVNEMLQESMNKTQSAIKEKIDNANRLIKETNQIDQELGKEPSAEPIAEAAGSLGHYDKTTRVDTEVKYDAEKGVQMVEKQEQQQGIKDTIVEKTNEALYKVSSKEETPVSMENLQDESFVQDVLNAMIQEAGGVDKLAEQGMTGSVKIRGKVYNLTNPNVSRFLGSKIPNIKNAEMGASTKLKSKEELEADQRALAEQMKQQRIQYSSATRTENVEQTVNKTAKVEKRLADEAKRREELAQAKAEAEAKAKAEAERQKQEAEAKAEAKRQKQEADAKAEAEAKAQAEAEKQKQEAEAKAKAEAKAQAEAEKQKQEANTKAKAEAENNKADDDDELDAEQKEQKAEIERIYQQEMAKGGLNDAQAKEQAEKNRKEREETQQQLDEIDNLFNNLEESDAFKTDRDLRQDLAEKAAQEQKVNEFTNEIASTIINSTTSADVLRNSLAQRAQELGIDASRSEQLINEALRAKTANEAQIPRPNDFLVQ